MAFHFRDHFYFLQSELVNDGVNGLTFSHRDASSLATTILRILQQPDILDKLGQHGYLYSKDGQVPSIETHVDELIEIYSTLTNNQPKPIEQLPAPRRITFDTNPDDCNFSCVMCEQHSEHSPHQKARIAAKIRRRRMDFDIIKEVVAETASLGLQEIVRKKNIVTDHTTKYNQFHVCIFRFHQQWVSH